MENTMEAILERAKKIKKLDDEAKVYRFVEYRDIATGEKIEGMPKTKSPIKANRGFCTFCGRLIKKSVTDDRFCESCYKKQFPDSWKRSEERFYGRDSSESEVQKTLG
jgi:hypothetical protein